MESKRRQNELGERGALAVARVAIASALLFGAGCSDTTSPLKPVQVVRAAPTVNLQTTAQGQILVTSVTVINTSVYSMAFTPCGVTLERAPMPALPPGKPGWSTAWTRMCYAYLASTGQASAVSSGIIPWSITEFIEPGQSVTLPIAALVGDVPSGNFNGQPGQYRIRVPLAMSVLGNYRDVPAEWSVSEPFTLLPAACIDCFTIN